MNKKVFYSDHFDMTGGWQESFLYDSNEAIHGVVTKQFPHFFSVYTLGDLIGEPGFEQNYLTLAAAKVGLENAVTAILTSRS